MKIALCSSYVPFIKGGGRNIVDWLAIEIKKLGHQVEAVYLPQIDIPEKLFGQFAAFRAIDVTAADKIICFRPPSYLIPHDNKILWFLHHFRVFYDLWDSPYQNFPDIPKIQQIKKALYSIDNIALREAKKIFTISNVVSERLLKFNGLKSEILYPPLFNPEQFHCENYNNEIVYICRVEPHKRQHLLIEAMQYTKTNIKLRICGTSSTGEYPAQLQQQILKLKLEDRVFF